MPELIAYWQAQGLQVGCLSGDHPATVDHLAQQLALDWSYGGCSPQDKAQRIQQLDGPRVMLGDGLNDTLALQAADAGIVVAGGVLAGIQAGDVVMVDPSLALCVSYGIWRSMVVGVSVPPWDGRSVIIYWACLR